METQALLPRGWRPEACVGEARARRSLPGKSGEVAAAGEGPSTAQQRRPLRGAEGPYGEARPSEHRRGGRKAENSMSGLSPREKREGGSVRASVALRGQPRSRWPWLALVGAGGPAGTGILLLDLGSCCGTGKGPGKEAPPQ